MRIGRAARPARGTRGNGRAGSLPALSIVGHQRWRDLLFLHWPVPVDALRRQIPEPLEIDRHEGIAYAGIVAFDSTGLGPAGLPPPFGLDFLETNVRTYVRLEEGAPDPEPGVYFFSLDAGSRLAALGGRSLFGLPYYAADIRCERRAGRIAYDLRRRGENDVRLAARYEVEGTPALSPSGSLEEFLIERYRFHVRRDPLIQTVSVRHAPYMVQPARIIALEESLLSSAGLSRPIVDPIAYYSPGVDVDFLNPTFRRWKAP